MGRLSRVYIQAEPVDWKKIRFPTEAEWEFAARGGNKSKGFQYSGSDDINSVACYDGNFGYASRPPKTNSPNELGIYDMSGNVCEWCSDWYDSYSSDSASNPQGPSSGEKRIIRGGSCFSSCSSCRVSYREWKSPSEKHYGLGLRLAL